MTSGTSISEKECRSELKYGQGDKGKEMYLRTNLRLWYWRNSVTTLVGEK